MSEHERAGSRDERDLRVRLVASGRDDPSPPGAHGRALAALGLAAGAAATLGAGAATPGATAGLSGTVTGAAGNVGAGAATASGAAVAVRGAAIAVRGAAIAVRGAAIAVRGASLAKMAPFARVLLVAKWVGVGASAAVLSVGAAHRFGATPPAAPPAATSAAQVAPRTGMPAPVRATSKTSAAQAAPAFVGSNAPALQAAPASVGSNAADTEWGRALAVSSAPATPMAMAAGSNLRGPSPDLGARVLLPSEPVLAGHADAVGPSNTPRPASTSQERAAPFIAGSSRVLAREIASVDAARRALQSGAPEQALASLDEYAREFPSGELGPEATLLRIEALLQSGNHTAAEQLARDFEVAHASGPHRAKLQRLLGAAVPGDASISRSTPIPLAN